MPEPTTIGQRFIQLIQQLGLSKNAFAQSLDRTATVIQHLVDERNKPGYDLLCRVFEVYPNVSKDWLLLGTGPMLSNTANSEQVATGTAAATGDEAIDLAAVAGPSRRRVAATSLQPAEVAAAVALAANHTAQPRPAEQPAQLAAAPAPIPNPPPPVVSASQSAVAAPASAPAAPSPGLAAPPTITDPAYLAALLQAQHVQHQLALAEQRNQHLLEQQQLLQQMVQILQRTA